MVTLSADINFVASALTDVVPKIVTASVSTSPSTAPVTVATPVTVEEPPKNFIEVLV
jgi:hypothetical protein